MKQFNVMMTIFYIFLMLIKYGIQQSFDYENVLSVQNIRARPKPKFYWPWMPGYKYDYPNVQPYFFTG